MIIQISVTNFLSIRETQVLSLVASNATELESNTFLLERDKLFLLKSAGIYGGNATGKSNFLLAVNFVENFVVSSSKDKQKGELIDVTPFRLNTVTENAPSEFEFIFVLNNIRYQYGFSVTCQRVTEEYLFVFQSSRPQKWFHRIWDARNNCYQWAKPSSYFKGNIKKIEEATRDNALFVSTAVQMNHKGLAPIVDWFQSHLAVVPLYKLSPGFTVGRINNRAEFKHKVLNFLQTADIAIADLTVKSEPLKAEHLPDDMPESVKTEFLKHLNDDGAEFYQLRSFHKHNDTGSLVTFDFDEAESRGTQALFAAVGPILDVLENGRVLMVDEIDSSLHPTLVRYIVELFHNPKTNPKNAQLIFVTHDSSLLDNDLLRRDQIWFVEKNNEQATLLYPLSNYHPRKQESLQKGYLHGRYGGLPIIGSFRIKTNDGISKDRE